MKILILVNDYKTIANFRIEFLEALKRQDHSVHISVPFDVRNEEFSRLGCIVHENCLTRHGMNPLNELKLLISYRKLIKELHPDVLLTYTIKPNIYGSLASVGLKIPILSTVTGIGSTLQGRGIKQTIMLTLLSAAMKNNAVIFFQNRSNMELFSEKQKIGKKNVILPGSGVNLRKQAFCEYPNQSGKIKFIIVSRLRTDKGFDELFSAIEHIGKREDVEYHIVGWYEEDRYRKKIEEMQRDYPVIYHGEKSQSEVHMLISQSHCLIHPSYHEGMANVLMEASAAGRPCLASNIPGCKEVIDDGLTGFLFQVKDAQSVETAIHKFLSLSPDERIEFGMRARLKMENEFDRNQVVNTYLSNIEEQFELVNSGGNRK